MAGMLEISVVDNEAELEQLRVDWTHLLQRSSSNTVFLTWEWVIAWWRSYGAEKKLWVLKVKRGERLVALVPLYRKSSRYFGVFQYHELYLIGDGSSDSDYLDVITETGEEEVVARSIVAFLLKHRNQWDILFLSEIPETSISLKLLQRFFQQESCYWQETISPCTYVVLPSSWNDYLKCLRPRMRTKIRSLTKCLEQGFKIRFECCQNINELGSWLESLFELHNQRWRQDGQEGVFVS